MAGYRLQSQGNEGTVLHINEVYEHEPILPYQGTDTNPPTSCDKTAMQCVEISQPLIVTPVATVGTITTTCQGSPEVTCSTAADGLSCTVTVVQRVCLNIPIRFNAEADPKTTTIACAGEKSTGVCFL